MSVYCVLPFMSVCYQPSLLSHQIHISHFSITATCSFTYRYIYVLYNIQKFWKTCMHVYLKSVSIYLALLYLIIIVVILSKSSILLWTVVQSGLQQSNISVQSHTVSIFIIHYCITWQVKASYSSHRGIMYILPVAKREHICATCMYACW